MCFSTFSDDIEVVFYEETAYVKQEPGESRGWEAVGTFGPQDVHHQVGATLASFSVMQKLSNWHMKVSYLLRTSTIVKVYRELNIVRTVDEDTRVFSLFFCSNEPCVLLHSILPYPGIVCNSEMPVTQKTRRV